MNAEIQKGRGAQSHISNKFERHTYEPDQTYVEHGRVCGEEKTTTTDFLPVYPKSIVSNNSSPDLGFDYSINPYQGCEHGCVYCYARNSHEYWGYGAGVDFESKILIKQDAASLLRARFKKKSYVPKLIILSGNTDCYQPIERKLQHTRELLKVFKEFKHPVGIITKNALIARDLDILKELAKDNLVHVTISITTLDESVKRKLEPRTSSIAKRFETVQKLSRSGIPVSVNMAPVIAGLTNHEILPLSEKAASVGALKVNCIPLRLSGHVAQIFTDWVELAFPDRASKILRHTKETRDGKLSSSAFFERMNGTGPIAQQIKDMALLAANRFNLQTELPALDFKKFEFARWGGKQATLF